MLSDSATKYHVLNINFGLGIITDSTELMLLGSPSALGNNYPKNTEITVPNIFNNYKVISHSMLLNVVFIST